MPSRCTLSELFGSYACSLSAVNSAESSKPLSRLCHIRALNCATTCGWGAEGDIEFSTGISLLVLCCDDEDEDGIRSDDDSVDFLLLLLLFEGKRDFLILANRWFSWG